MTTRALLTTDHTRRLSQAADESGRTILVQRDDITIAITPIRHTDYANKMPDEVSLDRWK